jgi:hypothetical protein
MHLRTLAHPVQTDSYRGIICRIQHNVTKHRFNFGGAVCIGGLGSIGLVPEHRDGGLAVIDRNYLARHAATLLKLARSTSDRTLAAAMIDKAAELKARIDDQSIPTRQPLRRTLKLRERTSTPRLLSVYRASHILPLYGQGDYSSDNRAGRFRSTRPGFLPRSVH